MADVGGAMTTIALRNEVLRLEEELKIRQWHEQQLAMADGKPVRQSSAGLIVEIRTFDYTNGDKYEGEALDTLRHGTGRHVCANGDAYDGEWQYDKRHGHGTATFSRGVRYEGQWKEDLAHGTGKATYENGAVYEGDFRRDHRWGWGLQCFPDGSVYEGEWYDDLIEGKGRWSYPNGSFFEGELGNGRRVRGRFVAGDASTEYDGSWRQEVYHGAGVMVQARAWKYSGQWRSGAQHGHGVCEYAGGMRYEGGWECGSRSGRGTLVAGGGYKYEGEWADDRQHGTGSCLLESGDKYVGEWREGRRHGTGSCLLVSGDRYQGGWDADVRCGEGICEFANGDVYQGTWLNDKRHGFGRCQYADGTKFRGRWEEDGWVQSSADPSRCRVAAKSLPLRAVAGDDCEFIIQARDDLGNKRLTGGDAFAAELRGPSSVFATLVDNGDGTYRGALHTTVAGDHMLHVASAGEAICGSPYLLPVAAGPPAPRKCVVTGAGRSSGIRGKAACFVVEVRDAHGNRCCSAEALSSLRLEAELSCGAAGCPVSMTPDAAAGEIVCSYTAAAGGMYRLQLTCGSSGGSGEIGSDEGGKEGRKGGGGGAGPVSRRAIHLAGSPFSVRVHDGQQAAEEQAKAVAKAGTTEPATGEAAQLPPAAESLPAVRDESQLWRDIAAATFAADGVMDGWDSDDGEGLLLSSEDKYLKAHPNVPVVENLEDLWMVSKLQRERKAAEEAAKRRRLAKMRDALRAKFGEPLPAPHPSAVLGADGGGGVPAEEVDVAPEPLRFVPIPTQLPAAH